MDNGKRILVIDDDTRLQDLLREYLQAEGFEVSAHHDGRTALAAAEQAAPDLVVLDIMLPGQNGLDILRDLRQDSRLPVIMLTARGDDADRIVGLELGADDYLAKPFNPRELLARIRAVLRRAEAPQPETPPRLEVAGLKLDAGRQELTVEGERIPLSSTETRLLGELMRHPGTEFSRDDLMRRVWGREFVTYDRSIDVHISKLRGILKPFPAHADRIRTVWGKGYIFLD
ncbi:response regulator [Desulfovibrio aminophilus]|nr:response regulator [Desulfovibrio aminophilus]MCM0753884.1 response regulator [Desulfovibrio aminophilus]